jgi:hypothetical protein
LKEYFEKNVNFENKLGLNIESSKWDIESKDIFKAKNGNTYVKS